MSENTSNKLQEVERKVTITPEDVAGAAEFWTHFEIPMPQALADAIEAFKNNPTVETQDNLKLQVTTAIGHTKHEAFEDEMFKEIVQECKDVAYGMTFERELEATLTEEVESK